MNKSESINDLQSLVEDLQTAITNVNAMEESKVTEAHNAAVSKYGADIAAVIRGSTYNTLVYRVPAGRFRPLAPESARKRAAGRKNAPNEATAPAPAEMDAQQHINQLRETLQFFQGQNADLFQLLKLALATSE